MLLLLLLKLKTRESKFLLAGVLTGSSNRFLSLGKRRVVFVVSDQQVDYKGGLMHVKMQDSLIR